MLYGVVDRFLRDAVKVCCCGVIVNQHRRFRFESARYAEQILHFTSHYLQCRHQTLCFGDHREKSSSQFPCPVNCLVHKAHNLGRILGLSAVHPLGPEMARQGHRWYRTKSWLVGWAYVLPREDLAEFVGHVDANPEEVAAKNEDQMLNDWILATGRDCWQPVPSPVDHDTSIASTYSNDDHSHRRTTVTWRGYRREDLVSADWWRSGPGPLLPLAWQSHCWACGVRPAVIKTKETSVAICGQCLGSLVGAVGARLGGMLHGPGAAT